MPASDEFQTTLEQAVEDMLANGFDSVERVDTWTRRLREAARRALISPEQLDAILKDRLAAIYRRMVERDGILRFNPGVERFTYQRIKPKLRAELDRRIMASANLIRLNRDEAIEKTLKRFQGWSTSLPKGGVSRETRAQVKANVRKSMRSLPFEERRVLIDQGHKLVASINDVIAVDGGAIAARWRSNWRQPNYDYREDHKERDQRVYLIRDSWAARAGLVKPARGVGHSDDVTQPGQEPFCRCYFVYLYNLADLPDDMLTAKGKAALSSAQGQEEVRSGRTGRADAARADGPSNVVNSGIYHLGRRGPGTDPACGRRAHMTLAREQFETLPLEARCKRCQAKLEKWNAIREKTGRADAVDDDKSSKEDAKYVGAGEPRPNGLQCNICWMFREPNQCTAVDGDISPAAYCSFFEFDERMVRRENAGMVLKAAFMVAEKLDRLGYLRGVRRLESVRDLDQWHAAYQKEHDQITMERKLERLAPEEQVRVLLHEAGHRGQLRMNVAAFDEFKRRQLDTVDNFLAMANPIHVADYHHTGKVEDMAGEVFAESYSRACLGLPMPAPIKEFWQERL